MESDLRTQAAKEYAEDAVDNAWRDQPMVSPSIIGDLGKAIRTLAEYCEFLCDRIEALEGKK